MKNFRRILIATFIAVLAFVLATVKLKPDSGLQSHHSESANLVNNNSDVIKASQSGNSEIDHVRSGNSASRKQETKTIPSAYSGPAIELSVGNFEGFVEDCFKGEKCSFSEDPLAMYRSLKDSGNERACDRLISFLRSKMKDGEYRNKYKNILKEMIEDFYPPEEKQFQEAAYYNYLGDLQKSLDLYLDLERKSQLDASLRPAPKLNIANTLYDMRRYKDSFPYYQAALAEYVSREQEVLMPSQNEMIRFIEERIEDVKKHL